jgi:hypothetical protein
MIMCTAPATNKMGTIFLANMLLLCGMEWG